MPSRSSTPRRSAAAGTPRSWPSPPSTRLPGIGDSDAHELDQIGQGWTGFPGRSADDLRHAIVAGTTTWHGDFYPRFAQVGMVGRQYRKKAVDLSADLGGRLLRRGTGRDLGYPGGRERPARYRADGEEAHLP